jgi:hypothetical protein
MEKKKLNNLKTSDILKAAKQVRAVHNCPVCLEHLKAIGEHQLRNHKIEEKEAPNP